MPFLHSQPSLIVTKIRLSLSPAPLISLSQVLDRLRVEATVKRKKRCSHDLLRSPLLSADCGAANFNLACPVIKPKINASFEKWKSNCPTGAMTDVDCKLTVLVAACTFYGFCLLALAPPLRLSPSPSSDFTAVIFL